VRYDNEDGGADTRPAGRPRDPAITEAITKTARRLVAEEGFARMSVERLAAEAGVGKPAIYRRFRTKAEVVAAAIAEELPSLAVPDVGDTLAEARMLWASGLPLDGLPYVSLIGGLLAEHRRHPELIEAFRDNVLLPRREVGRVVVVRGQERGDIRPELDPVLIVDSLVGPYFARVIAGLETSLEWRDRAFNMWWDTVRAPARPKRQKRGK
jgi:AcrR family transcriptional regulator